MTPSMRRAIGPPRQNALRTPRSRHARRIAPAVEIVVESTLWRSHPNAKALLRRAVAAAASAVSAAGGEVAVVLTDDAAIRALNRDWRRKDTATNVLSFPMTGKRGPKPCAPCLLGDIVIAFETTQREARAERKPFAHHLAHLVVHGFLHLVGYDHGAESEAQEMEGLETSILARMGVPDPYIVR
jgi:probable rRNA maturation factor